MLRALGEDLQEVAPSSVTVHSRGGFDAMSGKGAAVAQLLSAFQTGQTWALTGLVCGERLSPDAALTPLPSCMLFTFRCWHLLKAEKTALSAPTFLDRDQNLTMPGLRAPPADAVGPVGLPRTNWTLTTALADPPGLLDLDSSKKEQSNHSFQC